ncbi:MAG: hypothetical protein R3209_11450 [Salinimicrobium sediminis]|nr:hypothetical protein [Salinimicrobium sediminis]
MKKTKLLTGFLMAIALIFTSCSKEEDAAIKDDEKAYLSFQTQINDLIPKNHSKQADLDIPECTVGTPAFVEIILSNGDVYVAGSESNPLRLDLNPNAPDTNGDGAPDYFTEESATLELNPGTYTLQYFTVLDADGNVLWIAPMDDNSPGGIDDMVEQSLPMDINLGAGVKKYQNVEVVCFDDRIVNQYGYLFYDLNGIQLIEFCIFGNYCDETGRHAEYVSFSVDVWKYSHNPLDPKGEMLYDDEENAIVVTDYEDYAETAAVPLCITLPDGPGLDEYYLEITLLYPGEEGTLIRSGLISDADVTALFNGEDEVEYYHFREGNCNLDDSPVLLDVPEEGLQCITIDFEDLDSRPPFNSESYSAYDVSILAGPGYPENAMKIMPGTCSENVLHSLNYPYASVLFNFSTPVKTVSLVSGDYGEDQDTISVTAYSGENGSGEIITSQTLVLEEDASGCLEFNLEAEGIRSVIVFGQSSIEGHNNKIFTDNLTFCR